MGIEHERYHLPAWGLLPIEQCLIRLWDYSSSETVEQQRRRLIHNYIQLDEIPQEWDKTAFGADMDRADEGRIPTAEEVATILRPWRSDAMRKRAWQMWLGGGSGESAFLRTHYSQDPHSDDDRRMAEWAEISDNFQGESDWCLLNDPEFFNFGSDWRQVFYILPEIAVPGHMYRRRPKLEELADDRDYFKAHLNEVKSDNPQWKQDPNILVTDSYAARCMLNEASVIYLLIVDKEAFETEKFLVVYVDWKQDITAQQRTWIDHEIMDEIALNWYEGAPPSPVFEEGTVGDKYRLESESGREFFGLTKADLEDEPDSG